MAQIKANFETIKNHIHHISWTTYVTTSTLIYVLWNKFKALYDIKDVQTDVW